VAIRCNIEEYRNRRTGDYGGGVAPAAAIDNNDGADEAHA
jgi:hypothetical protein